MTWAGWGEGAAPKPLYMSENHPIEMGTPVFENHPIEMGTPGANRGKDRCGK